MFRRRSAGEVSRLRSCPICGSGAVSARAHEDLDCMRARVVLRCGECDTCRQVVATVWAFDAYERRLARERDEIADALRRLERVGDVDLLA